MLTVDIKPKKDKAKDGKYPIYIRVWCSDKKYAHKFTKHWVNMAEWDEDKDKCTGKNAVYKNKDLSNQKENVELLLMETGVTEYLPVKKLLNPGSSSKCFYEYSEKVLKEMADDKEAKISPPTIARYESEIEVLKKYSPKLLIQDITPPWLMLYKKHRQKESENNTVWATFKFLRKIIKKAYGEKLIKSYPIYTKLENDTTKFKMPKYEETTPIYLTLEELDSLIDLLYEDYLTDTDKAVLTHFLLECTCGIRHSDWDNFQMEKIIERNCVKVKATKNDGYIYVPIDNSPRLKKVIEYIQINNIVYNLTLKTANQSLKYLASRAKIIKEITTHTGRHTCAVLLLEMGYSLEYVAEFLGISMRVVKVYAKITGRKMINEYDKLGGL